MITKEVFDNIFEAYLNKKIMVNEIFSYYKYTLRINPLHFTDITVTIWSEIGCIIYGSCYIKFAHKFAHNFIHYDEDARFFKMPPNDNVEKIIRRYINKSGVNRKKDYEEEFIRDIMNSIMDYYITDFINKYSLK